MTLKTSLPQYSRIFKEAVSTIISSLQTVNMLPSDLCGHQMFFYTHLFLDNLGGVSS